MTTRSNQRVHRSGALNNTRRSVQAPSRNPASGTTLRATTVAFTATDTITDSGNALAIFAVGQLIRVRGSPLNSRLYEVATSAAGTLTVLPAHVQTEGAGATIIVSREDS